MCGRYVLPYTWQEIHDHLQAFVDAYDRQVIPEIGEAPARYNIGPTQPILVVRDNAGKAEPQLMRWGLVPMWVKDPNDFPLIINARYETIMEKPAFKGGLRHHRCIIPASGYYEWRKGADGKKQPYYISMADGELMGFAGIYSSWMGPSGEEIDTAAIITVPSNAELKTVHDRMPAIIAKEQLADWLDVRGVDAKDAYKMLRPLPEGVVALHSVSTRVGSINNDDEGLIAPVTEARPEPPKKTSGQMDLF